MPLWYADDFSHPSRLKLEFEHLHKNNLDIVGCQVNIVDIQGQAINSMQRYERWTNSLTEPNQIAAMRFVELTIINPTLMGYTRGVRTRLSTWRLARRL